MGQKRPAPEGLPCEGPRERRNFYEKFGLGYNDKTISTIDASGVALAAIKALYSENKELKARLEKLESLINKK